MQTYEQTNKQTQKSPGQYFSMDKSTAAFAKASQMGSYTAFCRPVLQCHSAIDLSKKGVQRVLHSGTNQSNHPKTGVEVISCQMIHGAFRL